MSTWWKLDRYKLEIMPIEALSETAKYITVYNTFWEQPQRVAKGTEYFPTFMEARSYLMDEITKRISGLQTEIERERDRFGKVFMMDKPKEKQ